MQDHPALVLNADFRPLSSFPLSTLNWQDAVTAVVKDHVSVVAEYNKVVRSPSFDGAKRAFPVNYLHESWLDYLYWDSEIEP